MLGDSFHQYVPGRVFCCRTVYPPLTAQVTGQAWQCARESEGSGVRGIGQGWMWGRVTHRLFAWDCSGFTDEFTVLNNSASTPN